MARRFSLTIDCVDPARLIRFWEAALNYTVEDPPTGFRSWVEYFREIGVPEAELAGDTAVYLVDPDGEGPRIFFQRVPENKVIKNRIHLDLKVTQGRATPLVERRAQVDAEVKRLVAMGATKLPSTEFPPDLDHYFVVLQDPEGNEFCVG